MSKTVRVFLKLLKAGLWRNTNNNLEIIRITEQEQAEINEGIDWAYVYRLAEEQSVIGLVAAGIDNLKANLKLPKAVALQFVAQTLQIEQRNKAMNDFVADIVIKMQDIGIRAFLVKGQGVAQCYEDPLWRASGDVDFFLSNGNYDKSKSLLSPIASRIDEEKTDISHLAMHLGEWEVELHGSLRGSLWRSVNKGLDDIQDAIIQNGALRYWMNGNTRIFMPGANEDIVYVFSHILEHFYRGGIGLRQICDWCRLLWTYRAEINIPLLQKRLLRMGIMTEWKAFAKFAVVELGMPEEAMPLYSHKKKWLHKAQLILDYILETGNFGHNKDLSYQREKSYFARKVLSFKMVMHETLKLSRIFPLDAIKSWLVFVRNGIKMVVKGV